MAKKKPKTLEEALQIRLVPRRFRESGLSRVEFDAQELAKRERGSRGSSVRYDES